MFGSKNDFFKQSPVVLNKARVDLVQVLKIKGRSSRDIEEYLVAYDFFVNNPNRFDGATIVKDLVDVRTEKGYLDADAMLHDYEYIMGANKNFVKKWKSDWKYFKGMERNGKGLRVPRLILLTITGLIFIPYKLIVEKI